MILRPFFHPTPQFINWLISYARGRAIFDIGCGGGQLLGALWRTGYTKIAACDPLWHILYAEHVNYLDPERPDYVPGHLVIPRMVEETGILRQPECLFVFARPNHAGWVESSLRQLHPKSEAIYISKPTNRAQDLGAFRRTSRVLGITPGNDGERAYRVLA